MSATPAADKDACAASARDTLRSLQDYAIFARAQRLSPVDLGPSPPDRLWYSWDQQAGECRLFAGCDGGLARQGAQGVWSGVVRK